MIEYTADLTLGKIYASSGILSVSYPTAYAFDGNDGTLWHSGISGVNWISVDFGEAVKIAKVVYRSENSYQSNPKLQGSNDNSAWVDVYTLSGLTSNTTYTFEFENNTAYRYYRLTRTSAGYFNARTLEMMSLLASDYNASGTYITPQIPTTTLPAQVRLQTQATTPPNTSIKIEYGFGATTPTVWTEVTDLIPISGEFLWLRYTLETTDTSVTPTLSAAWLEAPEAPQDTLRITVNDFTRFNNVEGQLTVTYNQALGNLKGTTGDVLSFSHSFTPLDLLREINPNDEETIKAVIGVTLNYDLISYLNASSTEQHTIKANALSAAIEYTDVTIVNP